MRGYDLFLATTDYFADAIITNTSRSRQHSYHTKNFLPKYPTFLILHQLEKEFSKRIYRRLSSETIINVLVILIRFEPELVGVGKE